MAIVGKELDKEKLILKKVNSLLGNRISELQKEEYIESKVMRKVA